MKKIIYSLLFIAASVLVMYEEYTVRANLLGVFLAAIAGCYSLYLLIREFRVWTVKGGDA